MTKKDKTELWWAYAISYERVAKRLIAKGISSQEDADEILEQFYENIHSEDDLNRFSVSPGCAEIMYTYFNKRLPQSQYLSLTDIAREINKESPSYVIQGWLRSRNMIEFLRIWETKNNQIGRAHV